MNSATSKIPETDAKKFCIKEDSVTMDCIFYEIVSIKTPTETLRKINLAHLSNLDDLMC